MDATKKDRVWAPDPIDGYVLGYIVDFNGECLSIELVEYGGKIITAFYDEVYPALDEVVDTYVDDNCSLVYLNEATLLQNVRLRYNNDLIYTYVANILITVNPYKTIPELYSTATALKYKGKSLGVLPPHVFAIADKIYRDMRTNRISQSIIVSGESGAGKTETTKHVLRYLMASYGASSGVIEKRVVEANPLLESLGNSSTLRNINSSRFGKFVEIHFDSQFHIVGGHVYHYLLEKSRVCSQSNGERNYHIFYQMLAGAPADMRQALMLDTNGKYEYLSGSSIKSSDKEGFQALMLSMDCIGMSRDEKADMFRVVAAVLHLGNVMFEEDSNDRKGGSVIHSRSEQTLMGVARLLCIDHDDLQRCLTSRVMTTTKKGTIGTVINVPLKPSQAMSARDALAKAIYVKLFDWVIQRINKCFPFTNSKYYIGILDIAGFEYYQVNAFEQFCINYCNEKLQQLFNERVFKEEQELYRKEGLEIASTKYVDNQDCIDLIEIKGSGIIDLLDEECRLPRGSNENFTLQIHSKHNKHFRLLSPRQSKLSQHRSLRDEEAFIIRHFAGAVCYKTSFFLDKNNDALHGSLEQLVETSRDQFIRGLFSTAGQKAENQVGTYAKKLVLDSVSCKFRTQLVDLMKKLRTTETSFIRCIKPNLEMVSGKFIGGQVLSQLQCGGTVAVLKLMEGGYPSRTQFTDLYKMYQSFLPAKLARLDPRTFCEALFRAVGVKTSEFKFGNNKVFFKAGKFAEFDQVMHSNPENLQTMVAKVEQWLIRKQWRKVIYGAISVQKLSRKIRYREENAIIVQSYVRMCLDMRRHRPRYKTVRQLRNLRNVVKELQSLASMLKTDREKVVNQVDSLGSSIDTEISKIQRDTMNKAGVESGYIRLVEAVRLLTNEIQARQEQEKVEAEEREKLKRLREIQEKERLKKEEEALKKKQVMEDMERERKRREEQQMDSARVRLEAERKQQEETDRQFGLRLQEEEYARERVRLLTLEQERRDFELALRLAQDESQSQNVLSDLIKHKQREHRNVPVVHRPPANLEHQKIQANIKQYDLKKWTYAQLRDMTNTSCDVGLLSACQEELHRRLKVYHSWRGKNTKQNTSGGSEERRGQRVPNLETQEIPVGATAALTNKGDETRDRYFRVPFLRPSSDQLDKSRGWWYAHFRGQWIVRQLELYPNTAPLLLVAGTDDMEMCELSLEETGLTRKKGAEITEKQFEDAWKKCKDKSQTSTL